MLKLFKGIYLQESGQGLTEYALILGSIAIVVIFVLISGIFGHVTNIFTSVEEGLENVAPNS